MIKAECLRVAQCWNIPMDILHCNFTCGPFACILSLVIVRLGSR